MSTSTFSGPVVSQAGFSAGTSASPISIASGNLSTNYGTTAATSGDVRLDYSRLEFTSTGSGETYRALTRVTGTDAATGGTVNGAHISLSVNGTGTVSGAGNALRLTIGGSSATPGGTLAALQLDSDFLTADQAGWDNATWLRFTNSSTGAVKNLARIPAASNGTVFAAHTTQVMSHSIRIVDAAGVAYYIMCTNAATNRS